MTRIRMIVLVSVNSFQGMMILKLMLREIMTRISIRAFIRQSFEKPITEVRKALHSCDKGCYSQYKT